MLDKSDTRPHHLFTVNLFDMREISPVFAGVYCPSPDRDEKPVGITNNFLDGAEQYHVAYSNSPHFKQLLDQALSESAVTMKEPTILDVGAGSGLNSVVPLIQTFQDASILSTDLSPNLLAMLRRFAGSQDFGAQVSTVCVDATKDYFREKSFDFVFGGSILHHLIDPGTALTGIRKAMKPGATAVFFEPFEEGVAILENTMRRVIDDQKMFRRLPRGIEDLFKRMFIDWNARRGPDKSGEIYKHLDDKWLFTRADFSRFAMQAGFSSQKIVSNFPYKSRLFREAISSLLKHCPSKEPLPDWAWKYFDELDDHFTDEARREILYEATIILKR